MVAVVTAVIIVVTMDKMYVYIILWHTIPITHIVGRYV